MMEAGASKRVAQWRDKLERAIGFDSWGQVIEAVEEYEALAKSIRKAVDNAEINVDEDESRWLQKLAVVATLRAKAAQDLSGDTSLLQLSQMKTLLPMLKELPETAQDFPLHVAEFRKAIGPTTTLTSKQPDVTSKDLSDDEGEDDYGDQGAEQGRGQGTLAPRRRFPNGTGIGIKIERIQLKDPGQFIEPFFTVTIVDEHGNEIAKPQDTPVTNNRDEFIHFNCEVHLQVALEDLPQECAVFLEFKHYKPKKQKLSTKCYSFLELDELNQGTRPIEIYAKPTDFRRKKLHLLTEKKHYLYCTVNLYEY